MRKLTINTKADAASRGEKLYIYIEDDAGDTRISGTLCKKIGEIFGGKSNEFMIENGNLKLYTIAENQGQNYDYTPLRMPVGDGDVNLDVELKSESDGSTSVSVGFAKKAEIKPAEASRKAKTSVKNEKIKDASSEQKKTKPVTVILVIIAAMIIGTLLGYTVTSSIIAAKNAKPKDFEEGVLNITLTGNFSQEYHAGYSTTFVSKDVAVFVTEESFVNNEYLAIYDEQQYLKYTMVRYGLKDIGINQDVNIYYFEYSNASTSNGKEYLHYVYAYKNDKSFWTVEFVLDSAKTNRYLDKISDWAHSVSFD